MVKKKNGQQRGVKNEGVEVNKGAWTAEEDQKLVNYVVANGDKKWRSLPLKAGLKRCGKSCRLRWLNYLRPGIKRGNISEEEEDLIIRLHNLLGNRWSLIAGRIPGRTDNEIKNHWNTQLSKRCVTIQDLNLKLYNAPLTPEVTNDIPTPPSFISTSAPPNDVGLIPNPTLTSSSNYATTDEAQVQPQGFELPADSDFNFEQLFNSVADNHQSLGSSSGVHDDQLGLDDYCIINNDESLVNHNGYYEYYDQEYPFKFKGSNISNNFGCLDSFEQLRGHKKSEFDDLDLFLAYQDHGLCFSNC